MEHLWPIHRGPVTDKMHLPFDVDHLNDPADR
jgi:hypothetical protein